MKLIQFTFKHLAAFALILLAAGCASSGGGNLLDKENVAVAAGFKVITPTKPDQKALLAKLPPDKVTPVNFAGKTYYVLPDLKHHQAYVGGPKQFESYKKLRQIQLKNSENADSSVSSIKVVEVDTMTWNEWDGWGPMDEPGWY